MTSSANGWGGFLPLCALHARRRWGVGDFSDLEALAAWTAERGGDTLATLPLLSAFLDEPYDPSPYAPASRLFWNELYIDITRVPELAHCRDAQNHLTEKMCPVENKPSRSAVVTRLHAAARPLRVEHAVQGDVLSVWQALHGTLSAPLSSVHRVARFDDYFTLNLLINNKLCQRYSRFNRPRISEMRSGDDLHHAGQ